MKTVGCGCAREALRRLSDRDRLLLALRAQELSYRDIAVAARIRPSSVGRLLARARWTVGDERAAAGAGRLAPEREDGKAWTHMKCLNDAQIQAVVDREAADDVRQHAESCGDCGDACARPAGMLASAVVAGDQCAGRNPARRQPPCPAGAVRRIEPAARRG